MSGRSREQLRRAEGVAISFGAHIPELQLADDVIKLALEAAGLRADDTFVELGSGHGAGLVIAARDFGAHAEGVEFLPSAAAHARRRARREGVSVSIEVGDVLQYDPSRADVVLLHLGPAFHDIVCDRLERMLQPPARVIAAGWRVPGWLPIPTEPAFDYGYVYRPADPRQHGTWIAPEHAGPLPPDDDAPVGLDQLDLHETAVVAFRAAVDLTDIELHVDAGLAARASKARCARGQTLLVQVERDTAAPADAPSPRTVTLWARSANGRRSIRGPALKVTDGGRTR